MNPEATRFPSDLRIKILILSALAVDLSCAVVAVLSNGTIWTHSFDAATLCLLVAFKLYLWPREIVTDQFGLHSLGIIARKNIHIPWNEVGVACSSSEVRGFGPRPFGLRNDTIEFQSVDGKSSVAFTSHHPDLDRFLREVRLHGVTVDGF